MPRLTIPARDDVPAESKPILDAVQSQLGVVPNMLRLIASSPAALKGYTANNAALAKALDVKTRERIALAVAEVNGCDYCLSAHSYLGMNMAKISSEEIALNRMGRSGDAKADAAVRFAVNVVRDRGRVVAADVEAGMLAINGANVSAPDAPFGGVKWSGFGREDGAEGVMHCMVPKTIHES